MRQRAAHRIGEVGADQRAGIGAADFVRIVTRQPQFLARLPPAMLAADDAGNNIRRDPRFYFYCAARAFHHYPFFILHAET